jgi:hypothetical protein
MIPKRLPVCIQPPKLFAYGYRDHEFFKRPILGAHETGAIAPFPEKFWKNG